MQHLKEVWDVILSIITWGAMCYFTGWAVAVGVCHAFQNHGPKRNRTYNVVLPPGGIKMSLDQTYDNLDKANAPKTRHHDKEGDSRVELRGEVE